MCGSFSKQRDNIASREGETEMELIGGLLLFTVFYFFTTVPGLLLASTGWRLSLRIKNVSKRNVIRAALVSVAIAPAPYGHAGFFPAIFVVFFPPVRGVFDWVAVMALGFVWFTALLVLMYRTKQGHTISAPPG